jgi:hypothetical protein
MIHDALPWFRHGCLSHHDIDPLAIKWSDQINLFTGLTQAKGMTVKQ